MACREHLQALTLQIALWYTEVQFSVPTRRIAPEGLQKNVKVHWIWTRQ